MKIFGVLYDGGAWISGLFNLKFHRADRVMAEGVIHRSHTSETLVRFQANQREIYGGQMAQKQLFSEHFSLPCHYHSMND
jgi:hypothetical protein